MKTFMTAVAFVAGIAANAANAAPLPEAKPDDAGFSQQGLARLDDFFAREIAAKRVPGAVIAIARDGKLVQYKADGRRRRADADGKRPSAAEGKGVRILSGVRRHEGRRRTGGRIAQARCAG